MKEHEALCEHRWRYFVNVQSRAVRLRQCERCGTRDLVARRAALIPEAVADRLSA